jgi:hypothetical protein
MHSSEVIVSKEHNNYFQTEQTVGPNCLSISFTLGRDWSPVIFFNETQIVFRQNMKIYVCWKELSRIYYDKHRLPLTVMFSGCITYGAFGTMMQWILHLENRLKFFMKIFDKLFAKYHQDRPYICLGGKCSNAYIWSELYVENWKWHHYYEVAHSVAINIVEIAWRTLKLKLQKEDCSYKI